MTSASTKARQRRQQEKCASNSHSWHLQEYDPVLFPAYCMLRCSACHEEQWFIMASAAPKGWPPEGHTALGESR